MTEAVLSLAGFVVLMVATPGPANLVAMVGGAQIGVRRSFGFILGLISGKIGLNVAFGLGFGLVLAQQPWLVMVLKFGSGAYMIWLALQSWNDRPKQGGVHNYTFRHGTIVHPLNPKAWVMVILAWSNFAPALGNLLTQMVIVVTAFALCQLVFHTAWCWAGQWLGHAMRNSQILTRSLIILTVLVVLWAVFS